MYSILDFNTLFETSTTGIEPVWAIYVNFNGDCKNNYKLLTTLKLL